MRSKLFVPGSRPELFAKAAAAACDAISFDLEDAVPVYRKSEARAAVAAFLQSGNRPGKTIVVRVNALATPWFADDAAALQACPDVIINLPKVESAEDVRWALDRIASHCTLLANIETPKGLRLAAEIAGADPRVMGLQIGYADLFAQTGMDRNDAGALQAVRLAVSFAAAEAGIDAYDGAYLNVKDAEGFRAEAQAARRQGLAGKSCIHPSQIAATNEIFSPGDAELTQAQRVISAAAEAESRGLGAFLLDGEMIDPPVLARARAIIALAARGAAPHVL
jgi:citrate lyase subunit beta/citryl-CoA lyase